MSEIPLNQWIITNVLGDDCIEEWAESFLVDKSIQNLSQGTIHFYKFKLALFHEFCRKNSVEHISQITPDFVRKYLIDLEKTGHNAGGIHAAYRTLRVFLNWWEQETEPEGWKNPIHKVKSPKIAVTPIEAIQISHIEKLISSCNTKSFYDLRDKALFLFLLDTGARASEVCATNLEDIDLISGSVLIRCGKGRKPRTVFIGKKSRRVLRTYIISAAKQGCFKTETAVWVTNKQTRLTYWGLNQIIRRRSKLVEIKKPGLHDFRRAFAINFLRNGGDIYSLQNLMGHADLQVLRRYLAQTTDDLRIAHSNFSPVDNSNL